MTEPLDDPDTERLVRERRRARGLRTAARRAIALARRYRDEEGPHGAREKACILQALAYRSAARQLGSPRPNLARTGPSSAADVRKNNQQAG